ncbi:hypothetical protein, partial [Bordetella pertussis]
METNAANASATSANNSPVRTFRFANIACIVSYVGHHAKRRLALRLCAATAKTAKQNYPAAISPHGAQNDSQSLSAGGRRRDGAAVVRAAGSVAAG